MALRTVYQRSLINVGRPAQTSQSRGSLTPSDAALTPVQAVSLRRCARSTPRPPPRPRRPSCWPSPTPSSAVATRRPSRPGRTPGSGSSEFLAFPPEVRKIIYTTNPQVILSCGDDQGYELLLCDVDGVGDVAVQHAVIGGGTRGPGVSRCGRREGAVRRSPRASARAWRSRLLSVSSSRMRCVATSTRRSREVSEERWRSGTSRPRRDAAGPAAVRSRRAARFGCRARTGRHRTRGRGRRR